MSLETVSLSSSSVRSTKPEEHFPSVSDLQSQKTNSSSKLAPKESGPLVGNRSTFPSERSTTSQAQRNQSLTLKPVSTRAADLLGAPAAPTSTPDLLPTEAPKPAAKKSTGIAIRPTFKGAQTGNISSKIPGLEISVPLDAKGNLVFNGSYEARFQNGTNSLGKPVDRRVDNFYGTLTLKTPVKDLSVFYTIGRENTDDNTVSKGKNSKSNLTLNRIGARYTPQLSPTVKLAISPTLDYVTSGPAGEKEKYAHQLRPGANATFSILPHKGSEFSFDVGGAVQARLGQNDVAKASLDKDPGAKLLSGLKGAVTWTNPRDKNLTVQGYASYTISGPKTSNDPGSAYYGLGQEGAVTAGVSVKYNVASFLGL